jgi:hypothetical protein
LGTSRLGAGGTARASGAGCDSSLRGGCGGDAGRGGAGRALGRGANCTESGPRSLLGSSVSDDGLRTKGGACQSTSACMRIESAIVTQILGTVTPSRLERSGE